MLELIFFWEGMIRCLLVSFPFGISECSIQMFMWSVQKLPAKLECDVIEQDFQKLQQQQQVVSKKVLQLILQKHATFSEEFARLEERCYGFQNRKHISSSPLQLNKFCRSFICTFSVCSWRNQWAVMVVVEVQSS
jgi:hypothetical protein